MAIERQNYRSAGYVEARSRANKSPSRSSKSRNTTSAGNQNTGNAREDYISNYVSKGIVKGGGTKKAGGGYHDATVSGDRGRTAKQEFVDSVNKNNRRRAEASGTKFTPYKGGARMSSTYRGGGINDLFRALLGMSIPGSGFLMGGYDKLKDGLGSLNETLGDFREKTTGFRTQKEYEDARQDRIDRKRIDTIQNTLNKKYPDGDYSNTQLDERLAGLQEKLGISSTAQNVLTGRDLKGFTESRGLQTPRTFSDPFANTVGTTANITNDAVSSTVPQGITFNNLVGGVDQYAKEMEALESMVSPPLAEYNLPGLSYNIPINEMGGTVQQYYTQNPPDRKYLTKDGKMQIYNDGINFNTQSQGINNIDVGYPSNDLMAGLTKIQQKMLAGPQKNLRNIMGISDQEILNNISPFNDPEDPATLEEVQTFYGADGGLASMFTRRG